MTKFEPFCALGPRLLWQQHGHFFPQQALKILQILQSQQPPQQTQQPHRQHSSIITATTSTAIITAEATIAEANARKETVLSELLFLPSHPSGSAVGMDVGVGIIWLLVLVASARYKFKDNCYQKDVALTHYDSQYRSGSIVGLL